MGDVGGMLISGCFGAKMSYRRVSGTHVLGHVPPPGQGPNRLKILSNPCPGRC